ncbi:MAG: carbohydrate-binding domain-containing protein [Dehalococcoidia bacterium]|nr:carbohydrate-binding domain-containing protein [Dehalococcoidia bacterium]
MTLAFPFNACSDGKDESGSAVSAKQNPDIVSGIISAAYDSDDVNSSWNSSKMSYITLKGNSIILEGDGAVVEGNRIAITSADTYYISGKLDDGQIIVRCEDQETVKLVFYGVDITCSTGSPIYIYKAKKRLLRWRTTRKIM